MKDILENKMTKYSNPILDPFRLPFYDVSVFTKLRRYLAQPFFQTSAGCYVFHKGPKSNEILFLLWRRSHPHNDWTFPKGTAETGEKLRKTALRETFEETGLRVKIVRELSPSIYTYYYDAGNQKVTTAVHYYLAQAFTQKANVHTNPDKSEFNITQYKWVTAEEAIKLVKHNHEKERFKEALVFLASA